MMKSNTYSSQGFSTGIGLLGSSYISLTRMVPDCRDGGVTMTASKLRMCSATVYLDQKLAKLRQVFFLKFERCQIP